MYRKQFPASQQHPVLRCTTAAQASSASASGVVFQRLYSLHLFTIVHSLRWLQYNYEWSFTFTHSLRRRRTGGVAGQPAGGGPYTTNDSLQCVLRTGVILNMQASRWRARWPTSWLWSLTRRRSCWSGMSWRMRRSATTPPSRSFTSSSLRGAQ